MGDFRPVQDRMLTRAEFVELLLWDARVIRNRQARKRWIDSMGESFNTWACRGWGMVAYQLAETGEIRYVAFPVSREVPPPTRAGMDLFGYYRGAPFKTTDFTKARKR